jgi:fatty acid desaturase
MASSTDTIVRTPYFQGNKRAPVRGSRRFLQQARTLTALSGQEGAPAMCQLPKFAEQTLPQAENLLKALLFPGLLFASFLITRPLTESFAGASMPLWVYGALLLLALFNGIIILGMVALAHEAVHRVLFRRPFWNELIGGLLASLALLPFYSNRQFHLTHHSAAHQPGRDPEEYMHNRPFLIALTYGALVALLLQYRILFENMFRRFGERRYRVRVIKDVALIGCAELFYLVLVPICGVNLLHSVLPTIVMGLLVLGYHNLSDHYGLPPVPGRGNKTETILDSHGAAWHDSQRTVKDQVSGWVILTNPVLEWVWSGVNYHEVHHKFPWLSHAHLKPAFEATRGHVPYRVARGYTANLFRLARRPYYGLQSEHRSS